MDRITPHEKPDRSYLGRRVEIHPGRDEWMQGDRYGEVVCVTDVYHVRLDSGRLRRLAPRDLYAVGDREPTRGRPLPISADLYAKLAQRNSPDALMGFTVAPVDYRR